MLFLEIETRQRREKGIRLYGSAVKFRSVILGSSFWPPHHFAPFPISPSPSPSLPPFLSLLSLLLLSLLLFFTSLPSSLLPFLPPCLFTLLPFFFLSPSTHPLMGPASKGSTPSGVWLGSTHWGSRLSEGRRENREYNGSHCSLSAVLLVSWMLFWKWGHMSGDPPHPGLYLRLWKQLPLFASSGLRAVKEPYSFYSFVSTNSFIKFFSNRPVLVHPLFPTGTLTEALYMD